MSLCTHDHRYRRLVQLAAALLPPMALIGCGSVPLAPSQPDTAVTRPAQQAKTSSVPVLPPAGSGRGGYYMDDGPGDSPPEGLHDVPDAEPRVEAYSKRANRPYVVFGKQYTPITGDKPFKQRGIGSWYGKKFHGQKTSSGELYDMYKMTAAHPILPIPSFARVTNVNNGKQVVVRINDRGPFHSGRIIDLSYTAALKLGYLGTGSGELEVERLLPDDIASMATSKKEQQARVAGPVPAPEVLSAALAVQSTARTEAASRVMTAAVNLGGTEVIQAADMPPPGVAQPVVVASSPAASSRGFYLQLGAYAQAANAEAASARFAQGSLMKLPPLEVVEYGGLYRLYSGPFANRDEAAAAALQLREGGVAKPMIVQR